MVDWQRNLFQLICDKDNINASFSFTFTGSPNYDGLYFGDCARPAGFSEYVLCRCKSSNRKAKGFAITLTDPLKFTAAVTSMENLFNCEPQIV